VAPSIGCYIGGFEGPKLVSYNSVNVAFVGALKHVRAKLNALLQGQIGQAEFEAYYCRATKTLALWS
jgi:hypothetical protein